MTLSAKELGGIDVLFNSVGILGPGLLTDIDEQLWASGLDTNLKAMWLVTKHALGVMMEKRRGSIILVSSFGALRGGTATA